MLWIIGLIGVLIAQNVADYVLQTVVSMPYLRTLESIVGYSVRPVIIILFCKLVKPNGKYRIAWILAIYNAAVYFTATFSRFAFYTLSRRIPVLRQNRVRRQLSFAVLPHLLHGQRIPR